MVDYFKQLRPASFRGIAFMMESDDVAFGRRIVVHEFPGSDTPSHEDLGAAIKEFTIEAVVAGRDFIAKADALEKSLSMAGAASLVHPHYGEISVIVMNARRVHSSSAVGEVRFSVTLQRYNPPAYPSAAQNTASGLLLAARSGLTAAVADFNAAFKIAGLPDFIAGDAQTRQSAFMGTLNGLLRQAGMMTATGGLLPVLDVLSGGFASQLSALYQNILSLTAPVSKAVIGKTPATPTAPALALIKVMKTAATSGIDTSVSDTNSALSVRENNALALDYMHRLSAMSVAVGSVRTASFTSREEAVDLRDSLSADLVALRDRLGASGRDESWRAAGQLQAALNRDINERIGRLPKTVLIRPASVRSSLAIANRLYGDDPDQVFGKAEDIRRRNGVRHPGFVPAQNLEVLIDATA